MSVYSIYETAWESLNRSRSARWDQRRMKNNLYRATDYFIRDRYNNFKDMRRQGKYIEANQRIKDDLSTLIVENATLTVLAGNLIALPANYRHDLGLEVKVGNLWKSADPITHNEKGVVNENFHSRPGPDKTIYWQIGRFLKFDNGNSSVVTQVRLTYLKNPAKAYVNFDQGSLILAGATALTLNTLYTVITGPVINNAVTYQEGDTFTPTVTVVMTGAGSVAVTIDTDIPEHAQIELSDMLAAALSGNVENYQKNQLKDKEVNAQ